MRNLLAIIFAVIVTAFCSRPLISGLQQLVLPPGQQLIILSPTEHSTALAMFALFLCACSGLAVAVGCYFRRYAKAVRWTIVLLPMLVGAALATLLKAAQFRDAQSAAGIFGVPPAFSLRQAAFYMIPAAALAAGLLVVAVSTFFFRARKGQPSAAPNGGPATSIDNSGVLKGPPSVS